MADITVEIPPLPEGFQGTPDELFQFFVDNALFSFDGEFPVGQVGGSKPTADVGVWYSDDGIEKYKDGKYQPITDVPIGVCFPWASVSADIPANYLLCDGRSLLRADYPELFNVIGLTWGTPESPTTFFIPDFRGRGAIGAGTGEYKYQGFVGKMLALIAGSYAGFEWTHRIPLHPGAPIPKMRTYVVNYAKKDHLATRNPSVVMNFIIRSR